MINRARFHSRSHALHATVLVILLGGCAAGGRITNIWKDPSWSDPPMRNVYVVALRPDQMRAVFLALLKFRNDLHAEQFPRHYLEVPQKR